MTGAPAILACEIFSPIFTVAYVIHMLEFIHLPIAKANTVVYIYFTRIPISKDSTIGPMELLALLIPG